MPGGVFSSGKTSNVELDFIFQTFLPPGSVFPCSTFPHLGVYRNEKALRKVAAQQVTYLPIFIRHHWVAGIFHWAGKQLHVTLCDSAPSKVVHRDITQMFSRVFPNAEIWMKPRYQQRRGSEDCGLHMAASFFEDALDMEVRDPHTIASRLRKLFKLALETSMGKKLFLRKIAAEIRYASPRGKTFDERHGLDGPDAAHAVRKTDRIPWEANFLPRLVGGGASTRKTEKTTTTKTRVAKAASKRAPASGGKAVKAKNTSDNTASRVRRSQAKPQRPPPKKRPAPKRAALKMTAGKTSHAQTEQTPQAPEPERTTGVQGMVGKVIAEAKKSEAVISKRNTCYFLVASALASVGDGMLRSLTANSIGTQVFRKGFKPQVQYDVGDALASLKLPIDLLEPSVSDKEQQLAARAGRHSNGPLYVQQMVPTLRLPQTIGAHRFILGARFSGRIGKHGATSGHYSLSPDPAECTTGVYLPAGQTEYTTARPGRELRRQRWSGATSDTESASPPRARPVASGRATPAPSGDDPETPRSVEEGGGPLRGTPGGAAAGSKRRNGSAGGARAQNRLTEMETVLAVGPTLCLNGPGRLGTGGAETCPRTWFIFPEKPPHVQQSAWNAVTEQTRGIHRKWLHELRAMPEDIHSQSTNLAAAALELTRRMAVARRWRWSTMAKSLAAIAGALRQLPLYTTMTEGVNLTKFPEWTAATKAIQRYERESGAAPPPPITRRDCEAARAVLVKRSPIADLYLGMMWAFAARAGDISTLHPRDVEMNSATREDGNVGVTLTMRRGKGARFRGKYLTSSTLSKQDACLLHKLMCQAPQNRPLFQNPDELREEIRAALKRGNREYALPSVRKGAVRHLAAHNVPEEQLLRLTGHTRLETLHRYLGDGRQLTREAAVAQDSAGRVHHEPSS